MMSAERCAAANTLASYERDLTDLREFLGSRRQSLTEAATSDLSAYLTHLSAQGFAATSQARRLSSMRQFYRFLYSEGLRSDDPTGIIDAPKKGVALPKTMSVADVNRLLGLAAQEAATEGPGQLARIRMHLLLELLYATGMRVSELVSLPVKVLRQEGRFLMIRGKGNKDRMVLLSRTAIEAMEKYEAALKALASENGKATKKAEATDSPWLFPSNSKEGYLPRQVFARDLKDIAIRAGLHPRQCHRMCCATPSPATSCRTVRICARCRNCSATPTFPRHKSIHMCWKNACKSWYKHITPLPNRAKTLIRATGTAG